MSLKKQKRLQVAIGKLVQLSVELNQNDFNINVQYMGHVEVIHIQLWLKGYGYVGLNHHQKFIRLSLASPQEAYDIVIQTAVSIQALYDNDIEIKESVFQ